MVEVKAHKRNLEEMLIERAKWKLDYGIRVRIRGGTRTGLVTGWTPDGKVGVEWVKNSDDIHYYNPQDLVRAGGRS